MNSRKIIENELKEIELRFRKKISAKTFLFLNWLPYDLYSHPERYKEENKTYRKLKRTDLSKVVKLLISNNKKWQ